MFNLEENNYAYKKNYLWRKKRFEKLRYGIFTRWGKWRELKNYESTNSLYKNWKEVMRQYKGLLHKCRKCKSRWIPWMIHKNYKKWNRITAVNQQRFQVFVLCWAATNACHFDTWNASGPQENVFGNQCSPFDSSPNHCQGIHHSTTPGVPGSIPVHIGTGTPVARDEDKNRGTIPMPTFARRPSTMNSFLPVDIPQNSMVGQQRQQISELQFDKFPTPSTFLCWKKRFKNQVTTCFDFPSEAMLWIKEVGMVDSLDEFTSS